MLLEDICTDPAAEDSYAIRIASNFGQTEVVRMLLDDGRANPATNEPARPPARPHTYSPATGPLPPAATLACSAAAQQQRNPQRKLQPL